VAVEVDWEAVGVSAVVVLETVVVEILEHLVAVEVDWEAVGVSAVVDLEVTGVLVVVDGEVEAGEVVADLLD
jgi:hypothetical protein